MEGLQMDRMGWDEVIEGNFSIIAYTTVISVLII